jgi:hypothetical protein
MNPQSLPDEDLSEPAAWSNFEAQGYDSSSHTCAGGNKAMEPNTYQLQQWVYSTSNANITFAERLERAKW